MGCFLRIAKNQEATDFFPPINIKNTRKNSHGIEYLADYYNSGKEDSCTFRIYPGIIDQISNGYQMKHWYVHTVRLVDPIYEEKMYIGYFLFYMNDWLVWRNDYHANTIILKRKSWPRSGSKYVDVEHLYV